ncbi:MAG: cobalamin-binding domain-containing protein [Armatimonadota bacterium]
MATLLGDEIEKQTGTTVIRGLLDRPGALDVGDNHIIDRLLPDYSILDEVDYDYALRDAYIAYATRGCPNTCPFCAVGRLEPKFEHYLPLRHQVTAIEETFGPRQDLVLLDNNVLASNQFDRIVGDIIELGFYRGARIHGRQRRVDFNQGIDLRLLTPQKMTALAATAIKPLRLAFDDIKLKDLYVSRVEMAGAAGIQTLSNYVLYNYQDTPRDFYERLRLNVLLNQRLGMQIYSFPMKFIPLDAKDRSYVGPHWNRQMLRGVQCILLATKGMVGPKLDFFEAAFGSDYDEFVEITMMPDDYIIYREKYKNNGAAEWRRRFRALSGTERTEFVSILNSQDAKISADSREISSALRELLAHYGTGRRPTAIETQLQLTLAPTA